MQSQIQCPQCGGAIHLNTRLLVSGETFSCVACGTSVRLSAESRQDVSQAVDGFDQLKAQQKNAGQAADKVLKNMH
ncbi:MAG: hypothetical protein CMI02_19070 [Oceanospirillaceae bacterium]|nr:hypothetical protein [Oceanospirillaceae bacterium]MBT14130.1 hypothetical protein [Oceanospirillaceae bacterium]|tara:strand:- start:37030 stop:37257 length:228 start_codon:yes stop_codon:yes gene_type:complete